METKRCSRCKQEKPISDFGVRKSTPDGLWNYCKNCDSERRREKHLPSGSKPKQQPRYQRQVNHSRVMAKFYKVTVNTLTSKQWLAMLNESDGKCHYCGEQVGVDALVPDHVIPMVKGGANSIDNIVASCSFCNHSKLDRDKPMYQNINNARYAAKKLYGHITLETPYQRHWWKRLIECLLSENA